MLTSCQKRQKKKRWGKWNKLIYFCNNLQFIAAVNNTLCILIFGLRPRFSFFFNKFIYFYLSLAALDLCCWAQAFSSCSEQGLLFVVRLRFSSKMSFFAFEYFNPECFCIPNTKHCNFCSCGLSKLEVNLFGQSLVEPLPYTPNTGTQLILIYTQTLLPSFWVLRPKKKKKKISFGNLPKMFWNVNSPTFGTWEQLCSLGYHLYCNFEYNLPCNAEMEEITPEISCNFISPMRSFLTILF